MPTASHRIPHRHATNPSPVPLRLAKAPAAGHPLPNGEGRSPDPTASHSRPPTAYPLLPTAYCLLPATSAARVEPMVISRDSLGMLVTKGLMSQPKPVGMSRVRDIDSHSM